MKRKLSGLAINAIKCKNPVAVVCGHGRLSAARVRSVLGGHLVRGL